MINYWVSAQYLLQRQLIYKDKITANILKADVCVTVQGRNIREYFKSWFFTFTANNPDAKIVSM